MIHIKDIFWKKGTKQIDKAEAASARSEDSEADQWTNLESESLVLVMGVTGVGKSYFINKLKPGSVKESRGIKSRKSSLFPTRIHADVIDRNESLSTRTIADRKIYGRCSRYSRI